MLKDDPNQGLIQANKVEGSKLIIKEQKTSVLDDQADNRESKRYKKSKRSELTYILKVLNFLVGIAYILFAGYCYAQGYKQTQIQKQAFFIRWVLPAYIGLSGLVIILIECRIGFMVRNLRFFYNYFGRGLFNLYAGLMPLMFINDWNAQMDMFEIIAIVAASVMVVVGLLYMGLKCFCCEKEGRTLDKQQQQEDEK